MKCYKIIIYNCSPRQANVTFLNWDHLVKNICMATTLKLNLIKTFGSNVLIAYGKAI